MSGPLRRGLAVAAAVVVLAVASVLLDRNRREIDLTQDRSLTMTPQTREVVKALRRSVDITAYVPRQEGGRAEAAALLGRYRRLNPRIEFRLKDPGEAPGEVGRYGIDQIAGGVVLRAGRDVETGAAVSELELTAALARLQRPQRSTACFVSGHGERHPTDTTGLGYSAVAGSLRANGYTVEVVDLLAGTTIPAACDALVLAAPTAPLGAAADTLARWLADDGRALVLTDPESTVDLNPLVEPYGLHVDRGIVFEGSDLARLPGDPLTPVVTKYRGGYPFLPRLAPTFYPGTQAVAVARSTDVEGLTFGTFAQTSELAYLERDPTGSTFDPEVDVAGPVGIAAAADKSRVEGVDVARTRLAVFGDADFASNDFVDEGGGNGILVVRLMDWLTQQENLVAIAPNLARVRPLTLTEGRSRYALILSGAVIPLLFLIAGAMVWAVRRGR